MSIIAVISEEYLYKLKLFYRRAVPSNDKFYIVFFLVKFFPIILFTHSISTQKDSSVFTLSKIIRSLLITNHSFSINYISLCYAIYSIIGICIISVFYIIIVFYYT